MPTRRLARLLTVCIAFALATVASAEPARVPTKAPARVMLLGLFHFDNPGLDAVKYTPRDVMQPAEQAYLAELSARLARFAPTRVLLEYPPARDAVINQRYTDYVAGTYELPRNEIYQLGFRVAKRTGLKSVNGFDTQAPPFEAALWGFLSSQPALEKRFNDMIAAESARQGNDHRTLSLGQILARSNSPDEDRRNKGFYMMLNDVGASQGLFHGADASADWWHRNLRMYALVQMHAQPGERVLVIAGSGHTAILRDLLRADGERVEEDVAKHIERNSGRPRSRLAFNSRRAGQLLPQDW